MIRRSLFPLFALLLSFNALQSARGEGLQADHYRFTAPLGAVCLSGAYPFVIGDVPGGILTVNTAPTGKLVGEIELWGQKQPVTGTIKSRAGYVRLTILGRMSGARLSIKGKLVGGAFLGTAVTNKGKAACTLDVTATEPLDAVFDVNIAPDAKGRLRGTGTLAACGQERTVTVVASDLKNETSRLRVSAGTQFWDGVGRAKDGGFVVKWKAQGFGALAKGSGLNVLAN
jgi:hypothetical protein